MVWMGMKSIGPKKSNFKYGESNGKQDDNFPFLISVCQTWNADFPFPDVR